MAVFLFKNGRVVRQKRSWRGQLHFGCPHVQTEDNILTNVWSLEDSLWESPPYP